MHRAELGQAATWTEQVELLATLVELTQKVIQVSVVAAGGKGRDVPEVQLVPRPEIPRAPGEKPPGSSKQEIAAFFAAL